MSHWSNYSIGRTGDRLIARDILAGRLDVGLHDQMMAVLYKRGKNVTEIAHATGLSKRTVYRRLGPAVCRIQL